MDHPDRQYLEAALYSLKSFLYIMNNDIEHASQFLNVSRYMIFIIFPRLLPLCLNLHINYDRTKF